MTYRLFVHQRDKTMEIVCDDWEADDTMLFCRRAVIRGHLVEGSIFVAAFPLVNVLSYWIMEAEKVDASTEQLSEVSLGPRAGHDFQPHEDPNFGAAFGGGCGAEVPGRNGVVGACGWPRGSHRRAS